MTDPALTAALWPEPALLMQMGALLVLIGAFAGVLAGLLGVGGGIVLVPAFFYAFQTLGYGGDQLMQICLATSLATIIVTSLRSVMSHNKKGAVDWEILRGWGIGIALGAVVGVLAASALRSTVLQGVFGGLALVIGCYLGLGRSEWRLAEAMPGGGAFDARQGPGRLQDIELLAQTAAYLADGIPRTRLGDQLLMLPKLGLEEAAVSVISDAAALFWSVRAARLLAGLSVTSDPADVTGGLARFLFRETGAETPEALTQAMAEQAEKVAEIVDMVFGEEDGTETT